jgi:hypothetical protein
MSTTVSSSAAFSSPAALSIQRARMVWAALTIGSIVPLIAALLHGWSGDVGRAQAPDMWLAIAGVAVGVVSVPAYWLHLKVYRASKPDLGGAITLWVMLAATTLLVAYAIMTRHSVLPDVGLGAFPAVLLLFSTPSALRLNR